MEKRTKYFIRYLIRENYIEFNLFESEKVKEIIDNSKNSKDLLFRLTALSNKKLIKNKTIIFLDKVQTSSNVLTAIKFLVEQGSYKYILCGSLLGTELKDMKYKIDLFSLQ